MQREFPLCLQTRYRSILMTADIPRDNKAWAETIQIPENVSRGTNLNADYIVNSHPAVLDGFVNLFRKAGQR